MDVDKYIEHKNIGIEHNHTPFRWEVNNEEDRDNLTPRERYKLLLQRDTRHVFVSSDSTFYPIGFDLPPQYDHIHYGIKDGEWARIALPTDDTFSPNHNISEVILDTPSLDIVYNFRKNTYSVLGNSFHLPPDKKITLQINSYMFDSDLVCNIVREEGDNYSSENHIDIYIINNAGRHIEAVVPSVSTTRRIPVTKGYTLRVNLWINHFKGNIVDFRNFTYTDEYFTSNVIRRKTALTINSNIANNLNICK